MTLRGPQGFALFEAMISVVVVSLGFLAFAIMLMTGLVNVNNSGLRGRAVELAYEMADRTRANMPGAKGGFYNTLLSGAAGSACASSTCTPEQVAHSDFADWKDVVTSALPQGAGVVCLDSTPDDGTPNDPQCDNAGSALVVKIWWQEKAGPYRYTNAFQP